MDDKVLNILILKFYYLRLKVLFLNIVGCDVNIGVDDRTIQQRDKRIMPGKDRDKETDIEQDGYETIVKIQSKY